MPGVARAVVRAVLLALPGVPLGTAGVRSPTDSLVVVLRGEDMLGICASGLDKHV